MRIVPTQQQHLEILKCWICDESSAYYWCGPGLRYPFTDESFLEDIKWGEMASYSLISSDGNLLGFGQYYDNHGRCHLARLIISPQRRGFGHGRFLINQLMKIGLQDLGLTECSLFVINNNEQAIKCYKSLNFLGVEWPSWMKKYESITYMVRHA